MSKPLVITIGREYGSAGREIGRKLAADMGIKCYDKELLQKRVVCAKSFFIIMMRSLLTVSCIH